MKLILEASSKSRRLHGAWKETRDPNDLLLFIQSMVASGNKVEVMDHAKHYLNQTKDLNLTIFDVLMQSLPEAERILSKYGELRVIHVWNPDLYTAKVFINAVKRVYGGAVGLIKFKQQHRFDWNEKTSLGQVALTEIAEDPKAAVEYVKTSIYRGIPSFMWRKSTPWGERALRNLPKDKESMEWYADNVLGQGVES